MAIALFCWVSTSQAVLVDSTYITTAPTSTDVANWSSGWGSSSVTGWDYVGSVNGASGVYLGNGWVITAAHVGSGTFTLGTTTYSVVSGSVTALTASLTINGVTSTYTSDLVMFQISGAPSSTVLPNLSINQYYSMRSNPNSITTGTTEVVMIGYGGGAGKTWGANTITDENIAVTPANTSYVSVDFGTAYGDGNTAKLVSGDSGGAGFIYVNGKWVLAGINEAVDPDTGDSYLVDLSIYYSQIVAIRNTTYIVPEPETWAMILLGGGLILAACRKPRSGSLL